MPTIACKARQPLPSDMEHSYILPRLGKEKARYFAVTRQSNPLALRASQGALAAAALA